MKRSFVNQVVDETREFLHKSGYLLPEFSQWPLSQWKQKNLADFQEIFDVALGWDVTDLGGGDFAKQGLTLFTLRNGSFTHRAQYSKSYAEKVLICRKNQIVPFHFHWNKTEDIINRGEGMLCLQLYNSTSDEECDKKSEVHCKLDGQNFTGSAGCIVKVAPGNSITLPTGMYHSFWTEDCPMLLVAEVSACNDDANDNRFYFTLPRFSIIDEDEPIKWVLANEYEAVLGVKKTI